MEEKKSKVKTIIKIAIGIVALIVAVFAVLIIRKESIEKSLIAKAEETEKLTNYHMKVDQEGEQAVDTEVWAMDREHFLAKITMKTNGGSTIRMYRNGDEQLQITETRRTKDSP